MKRKRKIYTPESGMKGVISIIKQAGLQIKSIEYHDRRRKKTGYRGIY